MRIAVLGGGNGSFAAAGDFALAVHDVRLWRRDGEAVEAHRAAGGVIAIKDFRGRHEARPRLITADIGEAVHRAELIVCPVPATAQPDIARALAPHLANNEDLAPGPRTMAQMEPHRPRLLRSFLIGVFFIGLISLFVFLLANPGTR